MLTDILSAAWRHRLYVAFAVVGLVLTAIQVGFGAANADQPTWLTVALAVFTFLGGALGFTAAANVSSSRTRTAYVGRRRSEAGRIDGHLVAAIVLGVLLVWLLIQVLELLVVRG